MKRIWNEIRYGTWKSRLSVQMGMLILATNLLFLSISFFFQYQAIGRVLQENYEEACVKRFEQIEMNMNHFCEQIEKVSTRLALHEELLAFSKNDASSDIERVSRVNNCVKLFKEEMVYNSYIESILFFGDITSILRYDRSGAVKSDYFYEKEDINDDYYSTEIYEIFCGKERKLRWFGGYEMSDLGFVRKINEDSQYYILAVRNIQNNMGQLLIGVPMEYYLDIFHGNNEWSTESIYVIDESGQVVASKYPEDIGGIKNFSNGETVKKGIQRYSSENEHGEVQVLVYYLENMGWYLVDEIPIKEVMSERIYLRNVLLISCILSIMASFAFSLRWIIGLITPLRKLTDAAKKVGDGSFGYTLERMPKNEIGVLTREFNRMSLDIQELFDKNKRVEEEKRNFEMQSLRAQINPHLLYNTLNTIKWMAIVNNERGIAESVALLSEFLEPVFKNKDPLCTIGEELEYLKKYIAIMNLRVAGGYKLKILVPEAYYHYKVMRFLMQPIAENSILHGMQGRTSGEICIDMQVQEGIGYITIEDDGLGIEEDVLEKLTVNVAQARVKEGEEGIGVANVSRRIKNQYGEEYGLTIQRGSVKGTKVILKIRLETDEN